MVYTFKVAGAFGKVHCEELRMDNPQQIEYVKQFMLALAPEVLRSSLSTDKDARENAEVTMRWAMHLAVQYETFRQIAEKDTAAPKQETPAASEQSAGNAASGI